MPVQVWINVLDVNTARAITDNTCKRKKKEKKEKELQDRKQMRVNDSNRDKSTRFQISIYHIICQTVVKKQQR